MMIKLRDVKCKWINLDRDTKKNEQMEELVAQLGITDAERVSAVEGIEPHEGVRFGEEHYRSCAESHFKVLQQAIDEDTFPLLILEDDVDVEEGVMRVELDIPDGADAIYVGTSHGDMNYNTNEVDGYPNLWKVEKVFATHAILFLTKRYAEAVIRVGKQFIYQHNKPFDVGCAYAVQPSFNVYAPKEPIFYQADSKNEKNKWEHLTRQPLKFRPKKTMTSTIGAFRV